MQRRSEHLERRIDCDEVNRIESGGKLKRNPESEGLPIEVIHLLTRVYFESVRSTSKSREEEGGERSGERSGRVRREGEEG